MAERALRNPKIKPVWDSAVTEVLDVKQDKVTGVKLKNLKTGAESVLNCAGVFIAIGHAPNTEIFKGQIEMDANGFIVPKQGHDDECARRVCGGRLRGPRLSAGHHGGGRGLRGGH